MIRICYTIPSLSMGGTERQLIHLVKGLLHDYEITVICTNHAGTLAADARRAGAFVHELGAWGGWDPMLKRRMVSIFRAHRPDIVHTYMFGFDLAINRAAQENLLRTVYLRDMRRQFNLKSILLQIIGRNNTNFAPGKEISIPLHEAGMNIALRRGNGFPNTPGVAVIIGDHHARLPGVLIVGRQENQSFHLGQRLETDLGRPPVRPEVKNGLILGRDGQLIRSGE